MKTLKDKYQNNATKRIKQYEKLLETLKRSDLKDKDVRIKETELALQKQKRILSNIKANTLSVSFFYL